MSLIRQVWLLIVAIIILAFAAATLMSVLGARTYLETQLTLKNSDNAQNLAMSLGQQGGDTTLLELTLAAQFDTGAYRSIRLIGLDGRTILAREATPLQGRAPAWFVRVATLAPKVGVAQVSSGWSALGRVELESQVGYAHDELWDVSWHTALGFIAIGAVAMLVGWLGARRIKSKLEEVVEQAQALHERRYHEVVVPKTPELKRVAEAMNSLVGRVRSQSEQHATEVEHLRRGAHEDRLTGVSKRSHFFIRLDLALRGEDVTATGILVLVRLLELADLNRLAGHVQADAMLKAVARTLLDFVEQLMVSYPDARPAPALGRLNGGDFALLACAQTDPAAIEGLVESLRQALASMPPATVAVSAVGWNRGISANELLSAADAVLARAEARGPFTFEFEMPAQQPLVNGGEEVWRYQLVDAVANRRGILSEFPLCARSGELIHLECPLRLQLAASGPWMPAVQWLPLALRTALTARIDELALSLALDASKDDQRARGINLSAHSLRDPGLVPRLRDQLERAGLPTSQLISVEIDESAAAGYIAGVAELCRQLKPLGVRVGLEHAGERVAPVGILLESGLDFVKLEAGVVRGAAHNDARANAVRGMVAMLHGLGLQVYAEGIDQAEDVEAMWLCGLDGVTGPAVR
jgi:EAL domain-containing protein (putative c-di-GMP-specific phosphodiesterase class I)/GGDEF domain-containing protein